MQLKEITKVENQASPLPYYEAVGNEVVIFEHAYSNKLPLMLSGPTGCGKSRMVEYMAERLGQTLYTISCHEETTAADLIGRFLIKGAETIWLDGPVTRAVREGCFVYIDEIAEARPDTLTAIHSLTDYRRTLYVERTGEILKAPENFMLVASYNPGYQGFAREMKPSTKQRFTGIGLDYPPAALEEKIVRLESGLSETPTKKLVKLAQKIRNLQELAITADVSTRLLVMSALLMHKGVPPRAAVEAGLIKPLTDDRQTIAALRDLTALYL